MHIQPDSDFHSFPFSSRRPLMSVVCLLCLLAAAAAALPAQAQAQDTDEDDPVPYSESEFPDWMNRLRRAEILAAGSFPFMLFFSGFGYDSYRFLYHGFTEEFDGAYLPWPFKGPDAPEMTRGERTGLLLASAGLSIGLAVADYFLGKAASKKEAQRKAAEQRLRAAPPDREAEQPIPEPGAVP